MREKRGGRSNCENRMRKEKIEKRCAKVVVMESRKKELMKNGLPNRL
jgi:hypothetical protein